MRTWRRREFLGTLTAATCGGANTVRADDPLAPFDDVIRGFLKQWKLPGGSFAVGRRGRLFLARGYGLADMERNEPVRPASRYRIASISKPITAVTVLRLVEQGKLALDDRAVDLVPSLDSKSAKADRRIRAITIRQLLHHTAGWDRDASFDPMFRPKIIAEAVGTKPPADAAAIIRYMSEQPLDFDPGTKYAYSNFGYCVLGRAIERVTKQSYLAAVHRLVLQPCNLRSLALGRTRLRDRADDEVRYYYEPTKQEVAATVFPDEPPTDPYPYRGFYVEPMDSHGAWIAAADDLVRFAMAVDGQGDVSLLAAKSRAAMFARPPEPVSNHQTQNDAPTYYGLGCNVRPVGESRTWWHSGSLPGTTTLLVHRHDGFCWAALLNSQATGERRKDFRPDFDETLHRAVDAVKTWPAT